MEIQDIHVGNQLHASSAMGQLSPAITPAVRDPTCLGVGPLSIQGSIIAISSIASERYVGYPSASYSASKGAINQFIQNIAVQYANKNIRANCILPGLMNTPQIRHYLNIGYSSSQDENIMIDKRNIKWSIMNY